MNKGTLNQKYLGFFLIISSLTALILLLKYGDFISTSNGKKKSILAIKQEKKSLFQLLWEEDIKKMYNKNLFHNNIVSLNRVRIFLLDQNLHRHFDKLKAPFKVNKNGNNLLEVSFMSHHSQLDNTDKLIVQYNLINKHSKEMFWEYSRTIILPDSILN